MCCVVAVSACGSTLAVNGSYISRPASQVMVHRRYRVYPLSVIQAASCGYTVATQPGVCTIRLELATFLLHGPTDNTVTDLGKCGIISVYLAIACCAGGRCTTDYFQVKRWVQNSFIKSECWSMIG